MRSEFIIKSLCELCGEPIKQYDKDAHQQCKNVANRKILKSEFKAQQSGSWDSECVFI